MKKNYRKKLDYLRLFSCAAVFLYHLGILKGAYLAVNSFLVLSGYLAVNSFRKKGNTLKKYYLSRLKNIYLPLLMATLVSICLVSIFSERVWINLKPESLSVLFGYNNYWQLAAQADYFTRHNSSPFMHMWYMAIILQLDLLFPFLYFCLRAGAKKFSKYFPYIILGLLSLGSFLCFSILINKGKVMNAYYGSFSRFFALALGMICAFAQKDKKTRVVANKDLADIIFYVYLLMMLVMDFLIPADSLFLKWGMLISTLISVRLVDYAAAEKDNQANPWIMLLSGMTYEIYLLQYPLIYLFAETPLPAFIQNAAIIVSTLVLSFLFKEALGKKARRRSYRYVLAAFLVLLSAGGAYCFFTAADYGDQIAELQNRLDENARLIQERNEEFLSRQEKEDRQWEDLIDPNLDDEEAVRKMLKEQAVTGVGDSLMIDIIEDIYERFPNGYFDGKISRDLYAGNEILEELKNEGKLADTIILLLATNGDYVEARNENLMKIVEDREVFWVNAIGADDPQFNERFADFASNYTNLHIVDWVSAAEGHPEYFYYDGIHVMEEGTGALADLIYDKVYEVYLARYRSSRQESIDAAENNRKQRVSFYGNEALINVYRYLNQQVSNAIYNTDKDYDYDSLAEVLKTAELEPKVVFVFDQQAGLSRNEYKKLIAECEGHEVIIIDLIGKDARLKDLPVQVIDFSAQIKEHPEYLLGDKVHLSDDGNKALSEMISNAVQ